MPEDLLSLSMFRWFLRPENISSSLKWSSDAGTTSRKGVRYIPESSFSVCQVGYKADGMDSEVARFSRHFRGYIGDDNCQSHMIRKEQRYCTTSQSAGSRSSGACNTHHHDLENIPEQLH